MQKTNGHIVAQPMELVIVTNTTKKLIVLTLGLALITSAKADIDAANLTGTSLAGAGALSVFMGVTAGAAIAVSGGLALGVLGAAILIKNGTSPPSTPIGSPIQIRLNPKVPLITPEGWISPTGSAIQPTAPSTGTLHDGFTFNFITYTTETAVRTAVLSATPAGHHAIYTIDPYDSDLMHVDKYNSSDEYIGSSAYRATKTCDTGYTIAGTAPSQTCNLSDTTAVIKPKKGVQEIIRKDDNTFQTDPQINPSDVLPSSIVNVTSDTVETHDATGASSKVKLNSDGTSEVTLKTPNTDGTTTINKTTFSAPDSSTGESAVTGTSKSIVQGTGTEETTDPATGLDISSLNKEATQQQIKDKLTSIESQLKCTGPDCEQPANEHTTQKADVDAEIKKVTDKLAEYGEGGETIEDTYGWSDWVPEFPTSSCTPITGNIRGESVSWDLCPYIGKLNELIGWLMSVFGAWTITGIFFKRS